MNSGQRETANDTEFPIGAPDIARSSAMGDPSISVIVTCYNYGHFLEACLASILGQRHLPEQIIVVDDESTDDSAAILRQYQERIQVIRTRNGGQAAAFNAGFAASTGDLVLFLDADDMLHPEAVESLLYHWSDDLAALTFGLETVDADGRSTGLYSPSVDADRGDNRPRLLRTGTFNFPPTSGNAFSRWCLERTLPMPEEQWRISADSYLIRAAALLGRFDHVPRVLGSYRIHGTNNYAQGVDETPDLARHRANQVDVARALSTLAENAGLFARTSDEISALRRALRHRAEACLSEATGATGRGGAAKAYRRLAEPMSTEAASRRGAAIASSRAAGLGRLACSRWPSTLPFDQWIDLESRGPYQDAVLADLDDPSPFSPATRALEFRVKPTPGAVSAILHLRLLEEPGAVSRNLEISVAGEVVWCGVPDPSGTVEIAIPRAPWDRDRTIRINFAFAVEPAGWLKQLAAPRLVATQIRLSTREKGTAYPFLNENGAYAIAEVLETSLQSEEWEVDAQGGATLRGVSARMRLSVAAALSTTLVLLFGALPPRGWLHIRSEEHTLFTGWLGASRQLFVPLPPAAQTVVAHDLSLHFECSHPSGERLRIAEIAVRTTQADISGAGQRGYAAPLNLGETVFFAQSGCRSAILASGWEGQGESIATNTSSEAVLVFRPPDHTTAASLLLAVEPALDTPANARHLLAITQGDVLRQAVQLDGAGVLEIPFAVEDPHQDITLVIHSTFVPEQPSGDVAMAPFALTSLELRGSEEQGTTLPRAPRSPRPAIRVLLDEVAEVLDACSDVGQRSRLVAMRSRLVAFIAGCADKACLLLMASARDVDLLLRLGEATAQEALTEEEAEVSAVTQERGEKERDAAQLRQALLFLVGRPAFRSPIPTDFSNLPAPLFWQPEAVARYFGRAPEIHNERAHAHYVRYLERLLSGIDRILARERRDSAQFALAAATLQVLRSTRVIFGSGVMRDLIRLRSRCIERLLTRAGSRLTVSYGRRRATTRLRIGVFVRDILPNPEGWALSGMYASLDPEAFDAVLIRLEHSSDALIPPPLFREEVCLANLTIEESVSAIRALDLDVFISNCYVADWEKASAIVAHRLAPLQIWLGAVGPSTSGFRSFDTVISCRATEPGDPARHYTERLSWIEGPTQCVYDFPPFRAPDALAVRSDIGIAKGAIMLVSGAMAHKITDPLISAWTDILADSPETVLVLYPFATNWSMDFSHEGFRTRLDAHLEAKGVDRSRVVLLATQRPARVREIVSAAELYLDSFPYTGATTVCEALSVGTPVLTCAGDALRELTGASWVRAFGFPELIATTPGQYRAIAVSLCRDREKIVLLRRRLADRLAAGHPPHNDPASFGPAFSDALWRIALESGRFPELDKRFVSKALEHGSMNRAPSDIAPPPRSGPFPVRSGIATLKIAILASPRTGSTLLCDLLNQTSGIRCHYELFHDDMIQYCDRTEYDAAALQARNADPIVFLETLFAQGAAAGHSVIGFKHFAHLNSAVTRAVIADPTVKLIHIGRANRLAHYSSIKIAEQNGKWFSRAGEARDRVKITFDPSAFEIWQAYQRSVDSERLNLLAGSRRDVLLMDFVGLLDPATVDRLSRFLGMDLTRGGASHFQRQNGPTILDRFTNPVDVAAYLAKRGLAQWGESG